MEKFKVHVSKRQEKVLEIISRFGAASHQQILPELRENFGDVSRVTLVRDLNDLAEKKFITKEGKGRGVTYRIGESRIQYPFDLESYFQKEDDKRVVRKEKIVFLKPEVWTSIFSESELTKLDEMTRHFQKRLSRYKGADLKKELERITIEFSWKSSRIEGNTYSLLDTECLIKESKEAKNHTREESTMILNHKNALDYVWAHPKYFRSITIRKIEEIHDLIAHDLGISKGLRKHPVGIIGTLYRPHDNVYQIRESLEELCALLARLKNPFVKALVAIAGLSYLQPFGDGNKRTSRLIGNAILVASNCCPLSYRSVDEVEYKKAMILFYEQHTLMPFKKLFVEQYQFAVKNYFL